MIYQETICAISTAPGAGGVAVIRVSGTEAITICDTIFTPKIEGKNLQNQKPIPYATVVSAAGKN